MDTMWQRSGREGSWGCEKRPTTLYLKHGRLLSLLLHFGSVMAAGGHAGGASGGVRTGRDVVGESRHCETERLPWLILPLPWQPQPQPCRKFPRRTPLHSWPPAHPFALNAHVPPVRDRCRHYRSCCYFWLLLAVWVVCLFFMLLYILCSFPTFSPPNNLFHWK